MTPMPFTALALARAIEDAMPKKPTPVRKGIPIGSYDAITDAAGKMLVKPKRKTRPLPQAIAASKRKKWRAAK